MNLHKTFFLPTVVLALSFLYHESPAQNELEVMHGWRGYRNTPHALYNHLTERAFEHLDKRKSEVEKIGSLPEWQQRQEWVRKTLLDIVGPFPDKTPLKAKTVRTVDKGAFKVEHIIFESQPGFYVTSSLFIPNEVTKKSKAPAVIYCSGHTPESYRSSTYQHVILNLVKKGFVVFAFDPVGQGERVGYYDPETGGSVVGPPTREHAFPGAQAFVTGGSLTRDMIWDGIRAVDYLLTRQEVDPARIGITGRSGGGTQSTSIAAMDERIYAAAPENYITNYTRLLQSNGPPDAEQNFVHGIARGLDYADLLAVRAPKPTLVLTTTNDFFSIQGARETAQEVSRIYQAYGKLGNFTMVEDTGSHASTQKNREDMYAFFQEHLNNPGQAHDEETELLREEEMQITATGQLSTSLGGETVFSLNRKVAEKLMDTLQKSRQNLSTHLPQVVEAAKTLSGYTAPEPVAEPVFTGNVLRDGYVIEKYFVKGEGDYIVPYLLFVPEKPNHKALIYVHPSGKQAEAQPGGEIEGLVNNGFTVLAPDMIGNGEMGPGDFSRKNYFLHAPMEGLSYLIWNGFLLIDKTIAGLRAADVVRLSGILKNDPAITDIFAVARKESAPVLLHAAAFEPAISGVALINPVSSYRSVVTTRLYEPGFIENAVPAALTGYDLPDLAASLAPRKLLLFNVTDGTGHATEASSIATDMEVIRAAYARQEAENQLVIESGETPDDLLLEWMQ